MAVYPQGRSAILNGMGRRRIAGFVAPSGCSDVHGLMRGLNFHDHITAQLSTSGCRHVGASVLAAHGGRAGLSGPPGPCPGRRVAGRHHRYCRTPNGAMAGEAARPAVRDREPSGRRHQHRHRACRALAARRLHPVHGQLEQRGERVALPRYRLQVLGRPDAGLGLDPLAAGHAGEPRRAGRDRVRVHHLCQGRSRSDQYGAPAARARPATSPASCSR